MIAVFKHELRKYFQSLTAYVFGAFLLVIIGVGAMMYNLQESVSNFEYVLGFACIVFVVLVPILTMRTISEERKQKTDQLLYSLPISTTQVVLGKYLALLTVYILPLLIICLYPLIFSQYGQVYLPTSYGTILAFFVLGSALISMGIFISSLTDNMGLAAGVGIAAILFNFYSVSLAEYATSTALGSAVALFIVGGILAFVIYRMTKNENLAYCVGLGLCAAVSLTFWISPDSLEGLVPEIIAQISLFERFYVFVNGVFDLSAIAYYMTVIVLFLFLSVQSMEKRRYN